MNDQHGRPAATVRTMELVVAALLFLLGAVVIYDSIRLGARWGEDGPQAGYFPFYIGLLLVGSSGWIALQQLLSWAKVEEFAERGQLALVWAILWPMVARSTRWPICQLSSMPT